MATKKAASAKPKKETSRSPKLGDHYPKGLAEALAEANKDK